MLRLHAGIIMVMMRCSGMVAVWVSYGSHADGIAGMLCSWWNAFTCIHARGQ